MNCPKCNKEVDKLTKGKPHYCYECKRIYDRQYYYNTKESRKHLKQADKERSRQTARKYIFDFLSKNSCSLCPESDIVVLEFDHINREEKSYTISDMIRQGHGLEKIKKEVAKCRVLCANCHRRETSKQFNWHRADV